MGTMDQPTIPMAPLGTCNCVKSKARHGGVHAFFRDGFDLCLAF